MDWNKPYGMDLIGIAFVLALSMGVFVSSVAAGEYLERTSNMTDEVALNYTQIEKAGHPKLEQVLFSLVNSENPRAFAETKRLSIVGDKVRVIIILAKEEDISDRFNITIELQDKNLVQALVPFGSLLEVANDPGVNYIKVPEKYKTMEEESKQASFPSNFSLMAIFVIFIIIKIRNWR